MNKITPINSIEHRVVTDNKKNIKEYELVIVEYLEKSINIRAHSLDEAVDIAKRLYLGGVFVLNSDNHASTLIIDPANKEIKGSIEPNSEERSI